MNYDIPSRRRRRRRLVPAYPDRPGILAPPPPSLSLSRSHRSRLQGGEGEELNKPRNQPRGEPHIGRCLIAGWPMGQVICGRDER